MIRYYKKTLRDKVLKEDNSAKVGGWISMVKPSEDEIRKISNNYQIPADFLQTNLDQEEIARVEIENAATLFIFKVPFQEEEDIETLPLGIIITKENIITVCMVNHPVVGDFVDGKVKGFQTSTKARFLLQIIKMINHHYLQYLRKIDKKIEKIEDDLFKKVSNKDLKDLLNLKSALLYFSTAVTANSKIIEKLLNGSIISLYEEDKDLLEDISFDTKQAIEMTHIYSGVITSTIDTYASVVSNNLNIVMKFLTAITIIMSIPTMVFSFYGMNVILPFDTLPNAFIITLLIALILTSITTLLFFWKKYL